MQWHRSSKGCGMGGVLKRGLVVQGLEILFVDFITN
jgi:hypothetical protein